MRRRARGQAIALAAVAMIGMVGMTAFVIDTGFFLLIRRELQNAVDAAALAGVVHLGACNNDTTCPDSVQQEARDEAERYAMANRSVTSRLCSQAPTVATPSPGTLPMATGGFVYTLTVAMECPAGYSFGRILGLQSARVTASATAAIGSLRGDGCPTPFAVTDRNGKVSPLRYSGAQDWMNYPENGFLNTAAGEDFGLPAELKVGASGSSGGNFQAIELDGNPAGGANDYRDWIANQCNQDFNVELGGQLMSKTGNMVGPTQQGLANRGLVNNFYPNFGTTLPAGDPDQPGYEPSPGSGTPPERHRYDLVCPDAFSTQVEADGKTYKPSYPTSVCIAIIVFISDPFESASGRTEFTAVGFGLMYLEGYFVQGNDASLWGRFLRQANQVGDIAAFNSSAVLALRLIR